jgi:ribosomal-protein-alanine N-acetyltransferase
VPTELYGRRVRLRPLSAEDFDPWSEVRRRCRDWLLKWEPQSVPGRPDRTETRHAFSSRCLAREREWQLGTGYGFGIFVEGRFAGEINLSAVQRGPYQNAYVGYWIDRAQAGMGYMPESLVAVARFAFEELGLHRVQVSIIPRNQASRRVVEKVGLRDEGLARRYLQIAGVWEDHVRYAMTVEEWQERGDELVRRWLDGSTMAGTISSYRDEPAGARRTRAGP